MPRNLCLAVVLPMPGTWILTGSIWGEINAEQQCADLAMWRAEGYTAELGLLDLTTAPFRILTHHLAQLQRCWRRHWRRRVQAWLRVRQYTGARRHPAT